MEDRKINGVSRSLLQSLYTDTVSQWGVGGNAAGQLRAILDADEAMHGRPADATHYWPKQPGSRKWRKKIDGVWHEWCGGQWLHLVHAMEEEYVQCTTW